MGLSKSMVLAGGENMYSTQERRLWQSLIGLGLLVGSGRGSCLTSANGVGSAFFSIASFSLTAIDLTRT